MRRSIALMFILIIAASSLLIAKPTLAQTKPTVPEFTVKFVDNSYDYYVPPVTTTSTDPYTGNKTVNTQPGYTQHVENKTIELSILHQPYDYGENYTLQFNIRMKGHFEENWTELYDSYSDKSPAQKNSGYTVLSYSANYPIGSQIDFQVEAISGHHYLYYTQSTFYSGPYSGYGVIGISGWSNTQTITIPDTSTPSPTPSPAPSLTPSPSILEFPTFIVVSFLMVTVVLTAILYRENHSRLKQG